jgi:hypothetical protein
MQVIEDIKIELEFIEVKDLQASKFECIDNFEDIKATMVGILFGVYDDAPYWITIDSKGLFHIDNGIVSNINDAVYLLKKYIFDNHIVYLNR